jgi:hypothetical protein
MKSFNKDGEKYHYVFSNFLKKFFAPAALFGKTQGCTSRSAG